MGRGGEIVFLFVTREWGEIEAEPPAIGQRNTVGIVLLLDDGLFAFHGGSVGAADARAGNLSFAEDRFEGKNKASAGRDELFDVFDIHLAEPKLFRIKSQHKQDCALAAIDVEQWLEVTFCVKQLIEAVVKSFGPERIGAERRVRGIDIAGLEAEAKKVIQTDNESGQEQEERNDSTFFHVVLILSTLRWKCSSKDWFTSCMPYQMRSKIETFSVKVEVSSGSA